MMDEEYKLITRSLLDIQGGPGIAEGVPLLSTINHTLLREVLKEVSREQVEAMLAGI